MAIFVKKYRNTYFVMKKILSLLALLLAIVPVCKSQGVPTPTGARLTLDSITTEVIIYSPSLVRVIKYVGERPALAPCKELKIGKGEPRGGEYVRAEGHNKYKVDTGRFYAAVNDKDANVSFWNHDDVLILAEQHKTGRLGAPAGKKSLREVSQDFQFGRAKVDSIWCPTSRERSELKDRVVTVGDRRAGLPSPRITTEKGWDIIWNSPLPATLDAATSATAAASANATTVAARSPRKPGDITFTSPAAPLIDYFFLLH